VFADTFLTLQVRDEDDLRRSLIGQSESSTKLALAANKAHEEEANEADHRLDVTEDKLRMYMKYGLKECFENNELPSHVAKFVADFQSMTDEQVYNNFPKSCNRYRLWI
jgi:cyanate lyase